MASAAVAPSSVPENLATPRYPLLDSLRGLAALLVFAAHAVLYLSAFGQVGQGSPLLTRLDPGLTIFFLLSGFLLYRPFAQARYDSTSPPALVPFFVRRLLRIGPVYWVILPIIALYFGLAYVFTPDGALRFFGFMQVYDGGTITGGIGQAWTVCVEVTFYLLLPVWAWGLRRVRMRGPGQYLRSELVPIGLVIAFSIVWKAVVFKNSDAQGFLAAVKLEPGLYTLPAYMDALGAGMALAVLTVWVSRTDPGSAVLRFIDRYPGAFVLGAVGLYWLSGLAGGTYDADSATGYVLHQEVNILFATAMFLPAIFGDWHRGLTRKVLANGFLIWFAGLSYSFYLWHLGVMQAFVNAGWLEPDGPGPVPFLVLSLAISIALSAATWYLVGRPFIRLGARLPRGRESGDETGRSAGTEPALNR